MDDVFTVPRATSPLTTEEKKTAIKLRILASNNAIFNQAKTGIDFYYRELWTNTSGLTTQQVLDSFGTDAGALITKLAALRTFLNTLRPGSITFVAPGTITVNEDGTATCS